MVVGFLLYTIIMNATQVLMLYLKKKKKAYLFPKILKYINAISINKDTYVEQKKMGYDTVRNFLTLRESCLYYFDYLLREEMRFKGYSSEWLHICHVFDGWSTFIKNNINKNYFKVLIPHNLSERDCHYHWRNGYHNIDYTLKKQEWEKL